MAPRGLKKLLKDTQPCKLVGSGQKKRFEVTVQGQRGGTRLRGVTKRLENCIFSSGTLPAIARASDAPAGGHWRGPGGGRRRGSAVDAQVSRLAGVSAEKRFNSKMLNLTRNVFAALNSRGLEPVMGQRAVCSERHRIGTAADVVCHDAANNSLVIVELKCGHNGARTAAAVEKGKSCNMKKALAKAPDNVVNRHLAQLAVTHHLLTREKKTISKLGAMGVDSVEGLLMYANDSGVDAYPLQEWWTAKASGILDGMR
eukprot:850754-Prymnesium_polylepis.1